MTSKLTDPKREGAFSRLMQASWPVALVALWLVVVLIATSVSAWGRDSEEEREEDIREHAAFFVKRTMKKLDATEEQSASIQTIVDQAIGELIEAHGDKDKGADREAFRALLRSDTIDREALESMRADKVAEADRMSHIIANRLADAMEVLTPEQRAQVDERMDKFHRRGRHHGWH